MTMPPDQDPLTSAPLVVHGDDSLTQEDAVSESNGHFPAGLPDDARLAGHASGEDLTPGEGPALVEDRAEASAAFEPTPMFHAWSEPAYIPPPPRIPHLGHLLLLAPLALLGLFGSSLVVRSALHFHLFGVSTVEAAANDVHYTIASMATLYLVAFIGAVLIFPFLWHKSFFAGVQWNASAARRHFRVLLGAACICFLLAMVDELVLPGPTNAPIDKLFDSRAAAWLLFGFGVTFAPFFEELGFRGFLLPALCTAFDWSMEKAVQIKPPQLDAAGHPQWSLSAMVFASIATSVPFALMHAEQTAWSLGPFLLLVCVSLVLCWARLATRSLAASVLVHASYNLLLFSLMLLGTQGFKHLDKM